MNIKPYSLIRALLQLVLICLQLLSKAGFSNVVAKDRTDLFVASLKKELAYTQSIKEEFIKVRYSIFYFANLKHLKKYVLILKDRTLNKMIYSSTPTDSNIFIFLYFIFLSP